MTHDSGPPSIPSRHRGRDGPFQQRDGAPIHGEQGVLKTDGQTVVCGLCGRSFKALGPHVLRRHDLSATEYRDWLGLKASTGLVSPELGQRQRQQSAHLAPYRGAANASSLRGLTPEQRHRPRGQPIRPEEARERRASPARKAAGARRHEQYLEGSWQPPAPRDRMAAVRASVQARQKRLEDPAYRAWLGQRMAEAHGGPTTVNCVVCGTEFRLSPSEVADRRTCGDPACVRRNLAARRASMATRKAGVAARLRALEPAAFDGLNPDERVLLQRSYGLHERPAETDTALARRLGFSRWKLRHLRNAVVARLLGATPDV